MNWEPVIGLEVHIELNTKSKMFCKCSTDYFGAKPNTKTCPICLGLPGSLPYINEEAIKACLKIGLALNCKVSGLSRFERKNYFYPDLPKGYQVSQYRWPLCISGKLKIENGRWIRINRVHQEEDTAKLVHQFGTQRSNVKTQNYSLIDFNRSGVPLVEVVTEPDFHNTNEVKDYAKKLQQLFRYLGVSNADMERGDMRLEANVSVRPTDKQTLPSYRVELKNINSFRFMTAAIEYEIKRQIAALEKGERLIQETRGWNEVKKETFLQRSKEEAHDYRYFPDPDLPELSLQTSAINLQQIKDGMPEMPWEKKERFVKDYGVSENSARILSETKELAEYFEEAIKLGGKQGVNTQEIANYIINQKNVLASPDQVLQGSQVVEKIVSKKMGVVGDVRELNKLAEEAIKENLASVEAYKKGKLGALNVLLGAVMKKSAGKADINKVKQILEEKLK